MTEEQSCQGGWRCLYSPSCREGVFPETSCRFWGFSEIRQPNSGGSWKSRRRRVLGETLRWVRLSTVVMTKPEHFERMHTYSLGETIRLELDLFDRSGVLTVNAAFYETESGHGFSMRGDGEGRSKVTVVLTQK